MMKLKCGMVIQVFIWKSCEDILCEHIWKCEEILNTSGDSDNGYFLEVDLKYPDTIKETKVKFPFCPENKVFPKIKHNVYMKKIKPKNYTKAKKLKCDWTDKKNYLIHYRMWKLYLGKGMIVYKTHKLISFKLIKCSEKYESFNTQKINRAKHDL